MGRGGWWLVGAAFVVSSGCAGTSASGPATGAAAPAADEPEPSGAAGPSGAAEPGAAGAGSPSAAAAAAPASREPALAVDSYPPGVEPLSEQDEQELAAKCKPVVRHLEQLADRDRHRQKPAAYVETLASDPPAIAGVDVPRCAALLLRSTRAYVAKSLESQATAQLKRILVGLAGAFDRDRRLCPSAPPVPADLAAVRDGPYQARPSEWQRPGWQCAGFDTLRAPQRFQYELAVDGSAGRFEIIARGYPVAGQPAVELFLPGIVADGAIELHSNVYRR